MTPRVRPHREAPPPLWTFWCTAWLRLSPDLSAQWWHALQCARWSRPLELRSVFLCRAALGQRQGSMRHFVRENLRPQTLIDALEDVIQERCLPPGVARQIEEAILAKTHVSGLWV